MWLDMMKKNWNYIVLIEDVLIKCFVIKCFINIINMIVMKDFKFKWFVLWLNDCILSCDIII